eukprot:4528848-Pyramimonas_sp.AAC.1
MSELEHQWFLDGYQVLATPLLRWRRLGLRTFWHLHVCSQMVLAVTVMPTAIKESERPEDCPHSAHAKWSGSNQYGRYTKCMACKAQLSYAPHTPEELEERRMAKLTRERQKAVRARYKEDLKPSIKAWEGSSDPWVASPPVPK